MKSILLSLSILFILFTLKSNAQIDLQISSTDIAPNIDGNIDTVWENISANNIENFVIGDPVDPSDLSASFKTMWDANNIYVLIDVVDDSKINDSANKWEDDAIEIYFDIDNDKQSSYGENDFQYMFRWNDPSISVSGSTEDVDFVIVGTENGYVMEVKFPWSTLTLSDPRDGIVFGFDVQIHDDDDGDGRENKICWYGTNDNSWENPSLFATVNLTGESDPGTGNPEVDEFPAEKPNVSVNHGFFEQAFDVTISSPVEGMKIYYTLDGTDPKNSQTVTVDNAPVTVRIDPDSNVKRGLTPGVVLRTTARKDGHDFSELVTRSYLFVNKVKSQSSPGHDWPNYNVNGQYIDYPMDPNVVNDPDYTDLIENALYEIPSISVVTDNTNLFDSEKGIYVNAMNDGAEWERPASIELINPDGSKGFQINAGIRIRGGWSRHNEFAKHAFRFFFRKEYGKGKLDYPLFGDEGVDSFDKVDLRCSQNFSWSKGGNEAPYATYNRDVFSRELQREMGRPYTRSRYYHLYLNGLYWGLFQTQERSEARYAASYFGGEVEDYDVVRYGEATDGDLNSWRELWDICREGFSTANYNKIQGLDENGVRDPSLKVMVDVDNLIDYMNVIFFTGNYDAPVSSWGQNKSINNFYCISNKNNIDEGFRFFAHDNESTLLIDNINGLPQIGIDENRVNIGSISGNEKMVISNFGTFNPQWLHFKLSENEEYRIRFSDRAYQLYNNGGVLTPEKTASLFLSTATAIDTAIIAESARWGDQDWRRYTKNDDWDVQVQRMLDDYFPVRSAIVMEQLKNEGLLSEIDAPIFQTNDNNVDNDIVTIPSGSVVSILNNNNQGSIKYTLDGTDPRAIGNAVSSTAIDGNDLVELRLFKTTIIKARVQNGNEWSGLKTLKIVVEKAITDLMFTEIHYNPNHGDGFLGGQYEFIELYNNGTSSINLTASYFKGIQYSFLTETDLEPGEYLVLASNAYAFNLRYNFQPYGEYGGKLSNGGERITLFSPSGDTIISVKYNDKSPWPTSADGSGFSIVPITYNSNLDWDDGVNWIASSVLNGNPNTENNNVIVPEIIVNEVLANTDSPLVDAVELYNPNNYDVDVSNWYLSDEKDTIKWQIPSGTTIPANGYFVFYEGHYEGSVMEYSSAEFGSEFSLNSHGDEIYVFSANQLGSPTGYVHGFDFGDSDVGVSYGRHIISTGNDHFVPMSEITLGFPNSYPSVGPLVINQIMYHPLDDNFEYIELLNITNEDVPLYELNSLDTWKISGIDFDFPANTIAKAGESIFLVESTLHPTDFRFRQGLDNSVAVFNYEGSLDNGGETLILYKSAPEYTENGETKNPFVRVDKVNYNDNSKWPDADGNGLLLSRAEIDLYGNDPVNWNAVSEGLRIRTLSLNDGVEGVFYHVMLNASGAGVLTWSIDSGTLPVGISLNATEGYIEGTAALPGEYDIVLQVADQDGATDEVDLILTINENTQPIAFNDTCSTYENVNVIIDVLKNDIDNDGDMPYWDLSITNEPSNGIIVINNNQTLSYLPAAGFTGEDQFVYRIDDFSGFVEAQVFVNVLEGILEASVDVRVSQSSDDAEENINSGQLWDSSTDLELAYDSNPGGDQIIGIRFQDISIPQGATIREAYIQFTTDEVSTGETFLTFNGEATDNSLTFNGDFSISVRELTDEIVDWSPEPWTVEGEETEKQKTPDLSSIVQEIINRDGWNDGNAMSFIVSGTGTRTAESFNGSQQSAPLLHIEYATDFNDAVTPIAIASVTNEVELNKVVVLNGSNSYSSDGRILNYLWTLSSVPEGSNAQLSNSFDVNPIFTADLLGTYVVDLIVNNGVFDSEKVTLTISIENEMPIADAGVDQQRVLGAEVMLNGSGSFDPEGDEISYGWQIVDQPNGSNIVLDKNDVVNPKFNAEIFGDYEFSLTVSDGIVQSIPDNVVVTIVENQSPIADAGNDFEVFQNEVVILDGSGSYDPEGNQLGYNWSIVSKPNNSNAILSSDILKKPTFVADEGGEYIFELTVSDGTSNSSPVRVKVTVVINDEPIANAGENQQVKEGDVVYLDASNSFDPDGSMLDYRWDFMSIPAGSNAQIDNIYAAVTSFIADMPGDYHVELHVSDEIHMTRDDIQIFVDPKTLTQTYNLDENLKVYPNPFFNKLFVELDDSNKEVKFELYTISGSLVERIEMSNASKEQIQLSFNRDNFTEGIYLLMVKTENRKPQVVRLSYRNRN